MQIINRLLGTDIRNYFRFCPLCYAENSIQPQISNVRGMGIKDYITCTSCGAKWHIGIGTYSVNAGRLNWAQLVTDGVNGNGAQLLGKKDKPEFWQRTALEGRKAMPKVREAQPPVTIREKETIIKEIVMIPCKYCGGLMPQASVFCPNCGARRTA